MLLKKPTGKEKWDIKAGISEEEYKGVVKEMFMAADQAGHEVIFIAEFQQFLHFVKGSMQGIELDSDDEKVFCSWNTAFNGVLNIDEVQTGMEPLRA